MNPPLVVKVTRKGVDRDRPALVRERDRPGTVRSTRDLSAVSEAYEA